VGEAALLERVDDLDSDDDVLLADDPALGHRFVPTPAMFRLRLSARRTHGAHQHPGRESDFQAG